MIELRRSADTFTEWEYTGKTRTRVRWFIGPTVVEYEQVRENGFIYPGMKEPVWTHKEKRWTRKSP